MRIVDLRPWAVRTALAWWRRRGIENRNEETGTETLSWLDRSGGLPDRWMAHRVRRRPKSSPGGPLLVSVGNLALGGTGKTPVVGALARDLAERGLRGAILTRGFGSPLAGPLIVGPDETRAGDEARWHAESLAGSGWKVVQSRSRPRGLRYLSEMSDPLDVVLLEDAHQTGGLARHLDVVILDRWSIERTESGDCLRPRTGPVFPFGPWRESAQGAERASVLLVETERSVPSTSAAGQPVRIFVRSAELNRRYGGSDVEMGSPNGEKWIALSGIANPEKFELSAESLIGSSPCAAVRCGDHVFYDERLVDRVQGELRRSGSRCLVTTAKDWVKLRDLWRGEFAVFVVDLKITWGHEKALPDLVEERFRSLSETS